MQLGFVGLGRMGLNMVTRLARAGHAVVAYDRSPEAVTRAEAAGAQGAASLEALASTLAAPKAIWLMVPAGDATESTVNALAALLSAGDIVIDGGNSNFHDDVRRRRHCNQRDSLRRRRNERRYLGPREGYCLMVGGDGEVCRHLEPIFLTLAPQGGYLRVGDHGAGHFVKMIHNGIDTVSL
jgi:6-phosphogluconate dehydrogenase